MIRTLLSGGLAAFMSMALLPAVGMAQQASGIAGEVRDASGAILPGVTVEATSSVLIEKVRTAVRRFLCDGIPLLQDRIAGRRRHLEYRNWNRQQGRSRGREDRRQHLVSLSRRQAERSYPVCDTESATKYIEGGSWYLRPGSVDHSPLDPQRQFAPWDQHRIWRTVAIPGDQPGDGCWGSGWSPGRVQRPTDLLKLAITSRSLAQVRVSSRGSSRAHGLEALLRGCEAQRRR